MLACRPDIASVLKVSWEDSSSSNQNLLSLLST
jgi:hypothetical protein